MRPAMLDLLEQTLERLSDTKKPPKVVVIGGSHSTWSVAWVLLGNGIHWSDTKADEQKYGDKGLFKRYAELLQKGSVTIMHRSPICLYYPSEEEATKAGKKTEKMKNVLCALERNDLAYFY